MVLSVVAEVAQDAVKRAPNRDDVENGPRKRRVYERVVLVSNKLMRRRAEDFRLLPGRLAPPRETLSVLH